MSTMSEDVAQHIQATFPDARQVDRMAQDFETFGYLKLTNLVPTALKAAIRSEVLELLDQGNRIDITIPETGNTPRKMTTVGMRTIEEHGRLVPEIYKSEPLRAFLARITGGPLHGCPWEEEWYVIIRQEKAGDTHGWHWGDYSNTLIWLIEVPEGAGGELQCVPHTSWNKSDPQVEAYLRDNEPATYSHRTGDIYLLKSDTTLHRTIPLNRDCTRIILNTCWASDQDLARPQTHETMHQMFA